MNPDDYEIFTSDPKMIFKWSASIWEKIGGYEYDYWIGMTD